CVCCNRCQQCRNTMSSIGGCNRGEGLCGRLIKGMSRCTMRMDVDQPRRNPAPAHVDDLGDLTERVQFVSSDDADNLATLDNDSLTAGNPIGQNNRTTREDNTTLWLLDGHTPDCLVV